MSKEMPAAVDVLAVTPFGFVFELRTERCFYAPAPYEIYVDGRLHREEDRNVAALFGLESDTLYHIRLRGGVEAAFTVKTGRAGFVVNVRDYHAAGDGETDDTSAVNLAIYTAPEGAVVHFPPGTYRVDQVLLKSGVDLYLEAGAILVQNTARAELAILKGYQKNRDHSQVTVNASWEGHPLDCFCSLIYGKDVRGVRIYGDGVLDGSGKEGGWWASAEGKGEAFRPRNLTLNGCGDILLAGLTSRNSAAWNLHPFYSDDLRFYALNIHSHSDSPNTDGLNPESCRRVEIAGCRFDVGDDCIAIKAGKYHMARRHFRRTQGIEIRNCHMRNGHGGVVIGSEIACGVEDVRVSRCLFEGTDRGLRVKTRRGRGRLSQVRNIRFSHVEMRQVSHLFVINMFYNCDPDGHSEYVSAKTALPVDELTPGVGEIALSDIVASGVDGTAVFIYGLPEQRVEGVSLRNVQVAFGPGRAGCVPAMMDGLEPVEDAGIYLRNATGVTIRDLTLNGEPFTLAPGGEEGILWSR